MDNITENKRVDRQRASNMIRRLNMVKKLKTTMLTEKRRDILKNTPEYKETQKWIEENFDTKSYRRELARQNYQRNKESMKIAMQKFYERLSPEEKEAIRIKKREYSREYYRKKRLKKMKQNQIKGGNEI